MLSLLAALFAASQPAPSPAAPTLGRTAWILSTVDQSEWCPAGNVRLELATGRYAHTAGARRPACVDRRLERPALTGRLNAARLATVRAAALRVLTEGSTKPACRDGGRPQEIVISNGGLHILVLTTGAYSQSAPDDLSCWSDAAWALHSLLDETFRTPRQH